MREWHFNQLTKNELILTGFSVLHTVSNLFLGTFVVSFLVHNATNEIISVSTYRLFYFFAICMVFIMAANWCKNGNKTVLFGMNIITRIVLMGLIATLGSQTADWVIILGLLYGAFDGFYNLPMHAIVMEKVQAKRMVLFIGTKDAIKNAAKILIPVILGTLVTTTSLQSVAWAIMFIAIMEFFMLFMLPKCHRTKHEPVKLIGFFNQSRNIPVLRQIFVSEILRGFAWILETVVVMYIVNVFHTDMNLGIWSTVFAICTIAASWGFGRFCSSRDFKWIILFCSILLTCSAITLIIDVNRFSTLLYGFAYAIGIAITNQICNINILNIGQSGFVSTRYRTEYLVIRDVMLFLGRWGGCVALLYIGTFNLHSTLQHFIAILFVAQITACVISTKQTKYLFVPYKKEKNKEKTQILTCKAP